MKSSFSFFILSSKLANTATDTVESDEEEGAVPNPEDGSQEVDVPDGKQLMAENMAARPDSSDQVINSSLFLKEVNQILLGPDAPASSSQSTQSSPSRNRRRRTGDLEVLQSEPVIPIDPFTKREIEFAVKNKKCGHIYDRSALTAFLTQSRNPRCPNVGCVNRTQLTQNSVDVDTETNALIERLKHGD